MKKNCDYCGQDLRWRMKGECCSHCLNYEKEWDEDD